ncbi:MAG: tetratricopeptide repeat protein [Gemmatimonadaceae bacterium]
MFRLQAFGTAAIERDGTRLDGLSGQRKALALLTLLAVAGDRGLSRDKLLAALWSESDETRARGALKQLVHAIRQQLGAPDLLIGVTDLRLNPEFVQSDVADFDAALVAGAPERAVALYAGPFLDGFHLRDAAEFERWADAERAAYAARFDQALETLADTATAAGDHVSAVRWWSRLAASSPLDARVAVRLMTALGNAGDQAAALRHGRTYEVLARDELDGPADPTVAAAMARLSAAPLAGTMPESVAAALDLGVAPKSAAGEMVMAADLGTTSQERGQLDSAARSVEPTPTPAVSPPLIPGVRRRPRVWAISAAASIAAAAVVLGTYAHGLRDRGLADAPGPGSTAATPSGSMTARPSVGVLPFANTSGNPDDEHISDGLTDELIGALGKVSGLKVAGRTSAFALKGRGLGVRAIAETLHVGAVLEGSVRRAGRHLRVTAQLVSAADDSVLWAEKYDRELEDIFAVQEQIARAIVAALRVKLSASGGPLVTRRTSDPVAYELYLKGRYFSSQPASAGLRRAMDYFERAIARDSTYASPHAGLADAHLLQMLFAGGSPRQELPLARAAAARALALDSTLGEAHAAMAHVLFAFDWNWEGAGREYARAIELEPGDATVRQRYAIFLLDQGRFDDAASELTEALAIDPLSPRINMTLGRVHVSARRSGEALLRLRAALELNPQLSFAHQQAGHAYLQQGKRVEAIEAFRRAALINGPGDSAQLAYAYAVSNRRAEADVILRDLLASSKRRYVPPFGVAMAFAGTGDRDAVFRWLEQGYDERAAYMDMLAVTPAFDPIRSDPRYASLLRRMRLQP